jgi:hypothetical protein
MRFSFLLPLVAVFLALAAPAGAAPLVGDTQVPFSADRVVVTGGKTYEGKIYAAPGMQRHEQVVNGIPMIAILRADREVAWLIMPGLHVYAELAFPKAVTEYDGMKALGPPVGAEAVAGLKSSRYRVEHEGTDGSALDGWVWLTEDGIVTKIDGTYLSAKKKELKASYALHDIKLAPQDPALFEVPHDVKKMPPEMVQGLLSLQMPKH